jgi:tetratricopeptide (TPR) repeat protein
MDLDERLHLLESCHDWQGLVDELKEAIGREPDAGRQARLHLRLARVLNQHFLQGARALKHFQDAFKLDSQLTEALAEARRVYWDLGKLPMVRRLLELETQRARTQAEAAGLLIQLGDVAADQGDWDAADQAYQRAIEAAGADSVEAHERLRDLRVDDGDWRERVLEIQEEARDATPAERACSLVRAARVARRAAPEVAEELLRQAYSADPMRDDAAALYEGLLVAQDREASVVQTQRGLIQAAADPDRQAELALRFGARWGHRHKKPQLAAEFGEETLRHQPQNEAAFALLCDVYGAHFGDWSKVIGLADSLGARVPTPNAAFFLANAAAMALQELGDADRARGYYERLAEIAPEHPALARRGNHSGESPGPKNNPLRASERGGAPMTAQRPEVSELTGGTEPPSASEMNGSM